MGREAGDGSPAGDEARALSGVVSPQAQKRGHTGRRHRLAFRWRSGGRAHVACPARALIFPSILHCPHATPSVNGSLLPGGRGGASRPAGPRAPCECGALPPAPDPLGPAVLSAEAETQTGPRVRGALPHPIGGQVPLPKEGGPLRSP